MLEKRVEGSRSLRVTRSVRPTPSPHVWIGTSGWHYDSWRGPFFPKELRARDHLRFYAEHFATTELNGVFYRTPIEEAVRAWRDGTPEHFLFAWKASKFITHWKRLSEKCDNSIALMESRLKILGRKAGPVLFQLPPRMRADRERLAAFLKMLPKRRRYAFEFRHKSWYDDKILDVLRDRDVALCLSDHHDALAPWEVTARHVYIRGHGPGGHYRDHYSDGTLRDWASFIRRCRRQGREMFCYFDNDQKSAAPADGLQLMAIVRNSRSR